MKRTDSLEPVDGNSSREAFDALITGGFQVPDIGTQEEAPPSYGDVLNQFNLSQPGFEAGAAVTNDGRVNINIREKNRNMADLLAPTIRNQLIEDSQCKEQFPPAYIPPSMGGLPGQTPPPKMNIVVQIVGSRGDVQPFVALGKVLHESYGHRVRIATHAVFQKFIEENGLEFFNIGGDPAELMAFMVKNPGLMPGFNALKSGEVQKRRRGMEEILVGCWRSCFETGDGLGPPPPSHPRSGAGEELPIYGNESEKPFVADAIIANPPSFAHIHVAEKLGVPLHMMFTMPWSPTRAFPHPLANIQSTNTDVALTNYTSYALVEMMTWQGLGDVINRFRSKALDLEPLSLAWGPGLLTRLKVPYTYCWSPALIPKPNDWGSNVCISGFFFLNLASSYTPTPELAAYLANGPPPVYIGFGSIVVDNPNALTRLIFDAITLAGVRAIISQGWGGLGAESVGIPEGVFMLENCPHDWLFQHVSTVVHHGGAGTTAAGIIAGKPTIVVPFFGDQPFWGSMIYKAGAGPQPIPNKSLSAENLAEALRKCQEPETQARAQELGARVREENGCEVGGIQFHNHLGIDNIRCSLAPSRTAVWRVRRTNIRLSALAAAVLIKENLLQLSDLKLYRSKEYDTNEQPWDPISAVTVSLLADVSSISMGIAELHWDVNKAASSKLKQSQMSSQQVSEANDSTSIATATSLQSPLPTEYPSLTPCSLSTPAISSNSPCSTNATADGQAREYSSDRTAPEPKSFDIDTMMQAGRGVGRIVETGLKSPMNFCMGLSKGFRNAPRLYNDETVRPTEKVTGIHSGVKVAAKEFGFGVYDGLAGLVSQPLKGAEKDGARGLVKGFGKGIGGLMLKPAAGIWALPAYTMAGVHAEVRAKYAKSMHNYIIASRVQQGENDHKFSNLNERNDIIRRWKNSMEQQELQPFDLDNRHEIAMKDKTKKNVDSSTKNFLFQQGRPFDSCLNQHKEPWLRKRGFQSTSCTSKNYSSHCLDQTSGIAKIEGLAYHTSNNDEFERATQASVSETSKGNAEEDILVEEAVRHGVVEMRKSLASRIQQLQTEYVISKSSPSRHQNESASHINRGWRQPVISKQGENTCSYSSSTRLGLRDYDLSPRDNITAENMQITDEEYERIVQEVVQKSIVEQTLGNTGVRSHSHDSDSHEGLWYTPEESAAKVEYPHIQDKEMANYCSDMASDIEYEDAEFQRVLEQSRAEALAAPPQEDEMLRRALEESKIEADEMKEENIVLEYVKKQSIVEELYRSKMMKDKEVTIEEADEDLRRALEESLKMSRHGRDNSSH